MTAERWTAGRLRSLLSYVMREGVIPYERMGTTSVAELREIIVSGELPIRIRVAANRQVQRLILEDADLSRAWISASIGEVVQTFQYTAEALGNLRVNWSTVRWKDADRVWRRDSLSHLEPLMHPADFLELVQALVEKFPTPQDLADISPDIRVSEKVTQALWGVPVDSLFWAVAEQSPDTRFEDIAAALR